MTTVAINEVFSSIQGEGPEIGRPTVFIRFYGCDLRCNWCDSVPAIEGGEFVRSTPGAVAADVLYRFPPSKFPFVCFTGGEPTLQIHGIEEIVKYWMNLGYIYTTTIETAHHLDRIGRLVDRIVWSPKMPSSGNPYVLKESDRNVVRFHPNLTIKFVIASERDFLAACDLFDRLSDDYPWGCDRSIFLQSEERFPFGALFALVDRHRGRLPISAVRVLPQVHKLVGMR